MKFEELTPEFLSERAAKDDIFEVDGIRCRAIYNEGLDEYRLLYVDTDVDPCDADCEWIEYLLARDTEAEDEAEQ